MISPTQRSLALLRRQGALAAVVERWNSYAKVRQDLWRFGDILAATKEGIVIIQACRTDDQARRLEKIKSDTVWPKAHQWLKAGGKIEVWGWAIRGAQGTRKRATLTITEVVEGC